MDYQPYVSSRFIQTHNLFIHHTEVVTYLLQIITDPHYFVVHCSLQLVMPSGEEFSTQVIRLNLNSELTRLKESIAAAVDLSACV